MFRKMSNLFFVRERSLWLGLILGCGLSGCTTMAEYTRMQRALGMEIIELRQGKDKHAGLLKNQTEELAKLRAEVEENRKKQQSLSTELATERKKTSDLETELKRMKDSAAGNQNEIAKCGEMLKGGRKKLFELQTELNRKEEELKKKEVELNAKLSELASTKKKSDELSDALQKKEALLNQQTKSLQEKEEKLKSSLERVRQLEERIEKLRKVYTDLKEKLKNLIQTGKLRMQMIDGLLVLQLPEKILFASGSSTLKGEGQKTIAGVADILKGMQYRWQVSGHTDSVGKAWSNWQLSTRRALAVLRVMLGAGMAPAQLSIAGYGQFQPSASNDTSENRSLNRRTEIVLIPNLSDIFGSVVRAEDK